jgi:hypothetical protein
MTTNGKPLPLRIENGILLKPYLAPYSRDNGGSHRKPDGWTPDRAYPPLAQLYQELKKQFPDRPDFVVWTVAEQEAGRQLIARRRPYPGWFPVRPKTDRDISRAYRELFQRMNPDAKRRVRLGDVWSGPKVQFPEDGDYELRDGEMVKL